VASVVVRVGDSDFFGIDERDAVRGRRVGERRGSRGNGGDGRGAAVRVLEDACAGLGVSVRVTETAIEE
jgi:hypothetical protein